MIIKRLMSIEIPDTIFVRFSEGGWYAADHRIRGLLIEKLGEPLDFYNRFKNEFDHHTAENCTTPHCASIKIKERHLLK